MNYKSLITFVLICFHIASDGQTSKISFWENQQKGANYFNAVPTREWFESAATANIKFVRLTYEKWKGAEKYLSDLIEIFNKNQWHWSFYSYRKDVWENMDYELGTGVIPQKYWEYSSEKTLHLHYS